MYTRSYHPKDEKINVPENYDGNAFREEDTEPAQIAEIVAEPAIEEPVILHAPWDNPPPPKSPPPESEEVMGRGKSYDGIFGGLFKKLPLSNLFGGFDFFKNGLFDFGSEEILIIGVALFLLFTKGGDKECAIMLLLLLLIK